MSLVEGQCWGNSVRFLPKTSLDNSMGSFALVHSPKLDHQISGATFCSNVPRQLIASLKRENRRARKTVWGATRGANDLIHCRWRRPGPWSEHCSV